MIWVSGSMARSIGIKAYIAVRHKVATSLGSIDIDDSTIIDIEIDVVCTLSIVAAKRKGGTEVGSRILIVCIVTIRHISSQAIFSISERSIAACPVSIVIVGPRDINSVLESEPNL